MGGVMGPQAWSLLVLGVLLACGGQLISGQGYPSYGEGYSVRCTIGIKHTSPIDQYQQYDPCPVLRAGFAPGIVGPNCQVINGENQDNYVLYEVAFSPMSGTNIPDSGQYLLGMFDIASADSASYGITIYPGTLSFYDIDECADKTSKCSPNAACYNKWTTYECECLDGYKDNSGSGRTGSRCDKEDVEPSNGPEVDIQIWVYVLIGVAIFVVLMLLVCCCCCYTGSGDCVPGMQQARTKVIKRVKIVPQPMQFHGPAALPAPPPPCICKPPEEKKIVIQVDQAPQAAPAPAPAPAPQYEPMPSGPSAFIANSGYDGKVYIAGPQAQPVQATRALPWADGSSMQTVNPPVYIQEQPQQVQYIQAPQSMQYEQPMYDQPGFVYDQPITTPYVVNVDMGQSGYYQ